MRDVWLITGVTLALLLLIELAFRAQQSIRGMTAARSESRRQDIPPDPFLATSWARGYLADHAREEDVIWEPYVYVRNPTFQGKFISVDSSGHRVTPVPTATAAIPLRVFFFGGSTMFGWYQRNENTIPAEASRQLQAAIGSNARVEPTNFGVPGRTFTQEIVELILQLRAGARPNIVVFYDGINDVMATVQDGKAGIPQNESNRVEDFARGRKLGNQLPSGFLHDVATAKRVAMRLVELSGFVQSVKAHASARAPSPFLISTDSASRSILHMYASSAQIVETLARSYGFEVVYVWQPALMSTTKPLTRREKWLAGKADGDRAIARIRDVHKEVPRLIGDTLSVLLGPRFVDETNLFSDDSLEVYVDLFGHTYERANPRIVTAFMPQLAAAARRALH